MDTKIKADWIAALRSGDYIQGRGQLRETDLSTGATSFCCLGVLCNLHAIAHPKIAAAQSTKDSYMQMTSYLPPSVEIWSGLSDKAGVYGHRVGPSVGSLANDNDNGKSFEQIAGIIERNF